MKNQAKKRDKFFPAEYQINICYEPRDKIFIARVPELENCQSHGKNPEQALKNAREAIELWLETAVSEKIPIPQPLSRRKYSGRFILRAPEDLHEKLFKKAYLNGESMNALVCRILEENLRC